MAELKVTVDARRLNKLLSDMPRIVARGGRAASKKLATIARNEARARAPEYTGYLKSQIKIFKRGNGYDVISGARVRSGRYAGFHYANVIEHGRKPVVVNLHTSPELGNYLGRTYGLASLDKYTGKKYMHDAFLSAKKQTKRVTGAELEKELRKERPR